MSGKKSNSRQKRIIYPPVRNQKIITDFAHRIKALLSHCKISSAQLSRYAEINYDYLKKIIKGVVNPSICHQERIADGFAITVSQFNDHNFFPETHPSLGKGAEGEGIAKIQLVHTEN